MNDNNEISHPVWGQFEQVQIKREQIDDILENENVTQENINSEVRYRVLNV
jgi:hypothetical protein